MIILQLISSKDAAIKNFADQFLGLRTIFEQTGFPHWILVDEEKVKGVIVGAQEPRELIQPAGTPFTQLYIFQHDPPAIQRLLDEAQKISKEHQAAFLGCAIDAEQTETASLLEKAGLELFDESYKMGGSLETATHPDTDLSFTRATPDDTQLILSNLISIMEGSSDHLMQASVRNISRLPPDLMGMILSQMEIILARRQSELIGIVSLTGPTISMIGVKQTERGKGYGRTLTQYALAHLAENGHIHAWLRVSVENNPALHIYETLGFRITNRVRYYLKKFPENWQDNGHSC